MCGILARVNRNKPIDTKLFEQQLFTLNKRGPDASGIKIFNNVALGHRRLSIVDLSEKGNQPMQNELGNVNIVFNGEIYNYKKVFAKLSNNHTIVSNSDTEVLIHGYEDFGYELFSKIEGMFSLCIYDSKKEEIIVARDHFGKKPLFYYLDDNILIFASELKAILADSYVKNKITIDKLSVTKFMYYGYIPGENTLYPQIKKIAPASFSRFSIREWRFTQSKVFWHPENIVPIKRTETDILSQLDSLLYESVEKRLMSDVPLGIFLSGGIDSTLVASYLSKLTSNLTSYTVSFPDYPNIDESSYADTVSQKCGFKSNNVNFEAKDVLATFKEIFSYLDEPLADIAIVPLYFISKHSRKDLTVVLGGDGGDELFGGYEKYKVQSYLEKIGSFSGFFPLFKNFAPNANIYKLLATAGNSFEQRHFIFGSGSFLPNELTQLMNKDFIMPALTEIFSDAKNYDELYKHSDSVNRGSFLDSKLQLPDWYLVKADRAVMANSQEMRSPMLDKSLAEFAFSLDGSSKIKNGISKYYLKKLAEKDYKKEFVYRKKKGFGVPLAEWIRGDLKEIFTEYCLRDNKMFNYEYISKMLSAHLAGKQDNSFKLLRIFCINYLMSNQNVN